MSSFLKVLFAYAKHNNNILKNAMSCLAAALGLLCVRGSRGNEEGLQWLKRSSEGGCVYGTGLLAHLYFIRKLFSKAAETAYK